MQKMYIVINKDLDMTAGKIGAHAAHAVFDYLYDKYCYVDNLGNFMSNFKNNGDTIVLLQASQKDMLKFEKQGYIAVRDLGKTEIEPNSLTAINLGIYEEKDTPKFIKRLRLYKETKMKTFNIEVTEKVEYNHDFKIELPKNVDIDDVLDEIERTEDKRDVYYIVEKFGGKVLKFVEDDCGNGELEVTDTNEVED